jgi:uncharacterized membrane protein (DUF4010 family)
MELGNIIAIVLIVGFVGFLAYKIYKSKKDVNSSGVAGGGVKPTDTTNVKQK